MATNFGKLEKVALRDGWFDEARDFTPWLSKESNLALLGEALGLELELVGTEMSVGGYQADIVAREVGTNDYVIIENQLEKTDHDHLGKVLTYAAGLNAKVVVWISEGLRAEHRRALDWLNESTNEELGFFGLEVELWKIEDSKIAPKFNIVCRPNEWERSVGFVKNSGELSETKLKQQEFWRGLKDYSEQQGSTLRFMTPAPQHWYNITIGRTGFHIALTVNSNASEVAVELYINLDKTLAKRAFDLLVADKLRIENEIGSKLEWLRLDDKKACRIKLVNRCEFDDKRAWLPAFEWLKATAEKFHQTFSTRVKDLELDSNEESAA